MPPARLAVVVGARRSEILRIGHAMGLTGPAAVTKQQWKRSYITIIKRNWHLLPFDQLLQLLGWTPEEMAFTLREDDFLFVKLGSSKPRCQRLAYQAPDNKVLEREKEIARILREELPSGLGRGERLFEFVDNLSRHPWPEPATRRDEGLRFCYSYSALYGDPLLETEADPYPEGLLARLAAAGVNGIWLQAVLHKLAPFPWAPELSLQYHARLKNLRALVSKAGRHGIRVFLYLNEPRSMPLRFFESRPLLKGAVEGEYAALCTSLPEVRDFLATSIAAICRAVPGLGGFFSITASENFTNCWSHGGGASCPRCSKRLPAEVIAEVNGCFAEGIRRVGASARLLAWDWGWNDAWAAEAIRRLPSEAALMSVSEWLLPINRGGIANKVGEYSLSAVGPGPRAANHWRIARERGLRTVAKIQAANTWELSAVPWIPAVANAAQHAQNLAAAGVKDLMLGWTLGGHPSPNMEVVSETLACGSAEQGMRRVAERRYGRDLAPAASKGWQGFSAAFQEFPYDIGVVYSGPQQVGPANLLFALPTGRHASMVGFPYDDLDAWRAVYPPDVFIRQLEKVADGFFAALSEMQRAESTLPARAAVTETQIRAFQEECRMGEAAAIHFRSVANQAKFILARAAPTSSASAERDAVTRKVLSDEIALARRLCELQLQDSRLGFEASNHYFYVPIDLAEKILNCRTLMEPV